MRTGRPVYAVQRIAGRIVANSGGVGGILQGAARGAATSGQPTRKEHKSGDGQYMWQHQQVALLGQHYAPPEQSERVAAGGNDRAKMETPALFAHGARPPCSAFAPAHT